MAKSIIAAVRARRDLKRTVGDTAREIAHQASIYGVVRHASLDFLAMKCRCSKQTVITHIKILIERCILRKRVIWIKNNFCDKNIYVFIIPWEKSSTAQTCNSQNSGQKLPRPEEREKFGSLREEIAGLHKGLSSVPPAPLRMRPLVTRSLHSPPFYEAINVV